jgi:hypothetical protein
VKVYVCLILFAVVVIAPLALRRGVDANRSQHGPGGDVSRLVIVTPHNSDIRREFAEAFDRWHSEKYKQPVHIDYRVPGGANDIKRLLENTYRGYREKGPKVVADIHMVWGGGDF